MKKILYKFSVMLFFFTALVGCEEETVVYDSVNGESFAGFEDASPSPIVFNPADETTNRYSVSASTVSSSDRTVTVTVDPESTLDPSLYTIETLNPVIPAGEFHTDIVITTPAAETFPEDGSELILNLESVEGSEIRSFSTVQQELGFTVACPSVDMESIPGTYRIVEDEFATSVGDDIFEIVAGPGENEFTMVNPFDHPNLDAGGEQNYEVVISVDPETAVITVDRQNAWHYGNFVAEDPYGVGRVDGRGTALTCIDQLTFTLNFTVAAGTFGAYNLTVEKQ